MNMWVILHSHLYEGVELGLDMDSRVALVGANGFGKTTLLNLITGSLTPVKGNVRNINYLILST